jgi:hypothetical protein
MSKYKKSQAGDNLPTNKPAPENFTKKEGAIQRERKSKRQKSKTDENQSTNTPEPKPITKSASPPTEPIPFDNRPAPAEEWTAEELKAMAASAARKAVSLIKNTGENLFALGQVAHELHQEVLNGAKRVPSNEDTFKRLAKELGSMGVRSISHKRLRALEKAYLLRAEMGGPDKAPDLPPDHFVAVVNERLPMEMKREVLDTAVEMKFSEPAVRKLVAVKLGDLDDADEKDASYWHDKIEKDISRAESILMDTCMAMKDHGVEIPSFTKERLNHLSVLIYQFANGQCEQRRVA